MRQINHFIWGIFLLLGACSSDVVFQGNAKLRVQRGEFNQVAIQVVDAGKQNPDEVLVRQQGYEEAKDRFFQMDVARRLGGASLGELFGQTAFENPDAFISDTTIFGLGIVEARNNSIIRLRKEHPDVVRMLEIYAEGVNQFIQHIENLNPELLKRYRQITGDPNYLPRAWVPEDSIGIGTQLAFMLSASITKKAMLGSIYFSLLEEDDSIDNEKLKKLVDMRPLENVFIMTDQVPATRSRSILERLPSREDLKKMWEKMKDIANDFTFVCPENRGGALGGSCGGFDIPGSNNWVVSRKITGNGETYLANDPHLSISFPSNFYEVALDSKKANGTFRMRGMSPVGLPAILIGHNDHIGWGLTNNFADVDDIYAEYFHPENPNQVKRPKPVKWVDLELKEHTFLVRDPQSGAVKEIKKTLRISPGHGPIVADHVKSFKQVSDHIPNTSFSYKWTGHEGSTEVAAIFSLVRAKNFDEFKGALKQFEVGAQNIVYADPKGNIGYYSHAKFPKRPYLEKVGAAPPFIPDMSYGKNEWDGFRDEVPELYNPTKGYIVTANNDPYGYSANPNISNYKDYFGFRFDPGSRAKRITDLIEEGRGAMSAEYMRRIQFDHSDLMACRMLELLEGYMPLIDDLAEPSKDLANRLLAWKQEGCLAKKEKKEPLQILLFMSELMKAYYHWLRVDVDRTYRSLEREDKDAIFSNFAGSTFAIETIYHKSNEALAKEDMEFVGFFKQALANTVVQIGRRRLKDVRWGEVHPLKFFNIAENVIPSYPFAGLERDGSLATVDMGGFNVAPELMGENEDKVLFPNTWGANFRLLLVMEEGKPIDGYNVLPGGNTSSLDSPNALRELYMWRDGKQRQLVRYID